MNWIQQNKKLAAILGVMIAGGLGLGVWLFITWSSYSAAQEEWTAKSQQASNMELGTSMEGGKIKVYPSAKNVKALEKEIGDYRDKFATLRKVLLSPSLQQEVKKMSETEFQTKVKERAKTVDQKAKEAGVILPKTFALGFEEYSGTLPPNADAAAELNVHLDVMEKLVMALINAKVTSLDDLQRTRLPVEKQKAGAGVAAPPASAPPPPASKSGKKGAPIPVLAAGDPVLDRHTIKCTFTTDQGPLQSVMNTLSNAAKTSDFLAVRLMRVENEKTEAPTKDEIRTTRLTPAREEAAPTPPPGGKTPAANVIPAVKPLPPDARAVIGAEALKVYLEVDYIRFRQPPEEAAPAPKR